MVKTEYTYLMSIHMCNFLATMIFVIFSFRRSPGFKDDANGSGLMWDNNPVCEV